MMCCTGCLKARKPEMLLHIYRPNILMHSVEHTSDPMQLREVSGNN